jgi:hypothetical protein
MQRQDQSVPLMKIINGISENTRPHTSSQSNYGLQQ